METSRSNRLSADAVIPVWPAGVIVLVTALIAFLAAIA
jgi:hypothetical protein